MLAEAHVQVLQMVVHSDEKTMVPKIFGEADFSEFGEAIHKPLEHASLEVVANSFHI